MLAAVTPDGLPDGPGLDPAHAAAEVVYSDVSWRSVTVLTWRRHPQGWAALIRWPDGSEDWRLHDDRYMRPCLGP